jgi:hypothetical protein
MTALWLLGKDQDPAFKKVRDWTAENDGDKMVIEMAVALGASAPKRVEEAVAVEPNLPAARPAAAPETVSPAATTETTAAPEPNQLAEEIAPEVNQPAETILAEPNQSEPAAATEPNQPKAPPAEPNDIIDDILKS